MALREWFIIWIIPKSARLVVPGTRPLLTQESPISDAWNNVCCLKPGDVQLNCSSAPTGFYSSAVRNPFLQDLADRSRRQIAYSP